jgi:hypothetical protein
MVAEERKKQWNINDKEGRPGHMFLFLFQNMIT